MFGEKGLSSGASRHRTGGLADEPDSTKHLHQQKVIIKERGYKRGYAKAWKEMLGAVYRWNKEVQQTETSIEFEMFIKDKLNKLKVKRK